MRPNEYYSRLEYGISILASMHTEKWFRYGGAIDTTLVCIASTRVCILSIYEGSRERERKYGIHHTLCIVIAIYAYSHRVVVRAYAYKKVSIGIPYTCVVYY